MRISCSSLFLWEYSPADIVDILQKANINSIEFWTETPLFWMQRHDNNCINDLKATISTMPHGCTLHAPIMDLNPASYNEYVYEATITETLWSIDLARFLDARIVTIHPGKRTAHRKPTTDDWKKFFRYLEISLKKSQKFDINLSLENSMPGIQSMCSTPDEMKEVMNTFPELHFTFDVVHAALISQNTALSFIDELGERIINLHVGAPHDDKPHFPSHHERRMEMVLRHLHDFGYDGDLTIEIDDKVYPGPLSKQEKINELKCERDYLEGIFKT